MLWGWREGEEGRSVGQFVSILVEAGWQTTEFGVADLAANDLARTR